MARARRGEDAERDREQEQDDGTAEDERAGDAGRLEEDARDGLAGEDSFRRQDVRPPRAAEVAVGEAPHVLRELHVDGPVGAERVARRLDLRRRGRLRVDEELGRLARDLEEDDERDERQRDEEDGGDREPAGDEEQHRHQRIPCGSIAFASGISRSFQFQHSILELLAQIKVFILQASSFTSSNNAVTGKARSGLSFV